MALGLGILLIFGGVVWGVSSGLLGSRWLRLGREKKEREKKMAAKKQSKADRMDESLGERRGKESTKKQSYKSRRDESTGMKKAVKRRKKV